MLGKNKKKGNENANKVTKAMILQAQMAQMEKSKKKSKKNSKVVEQPTELEENINKLGFSFLTLIRQCLGTSVISGKKSKIITGDVTVRT